MIFGVRHARHCRWSFVARADRTEAEMTMPGIRTSLFMVLAERSRNCWRFSPDFIMVCMFWIACAAESLLGPCPLVARGKRIVRAALVAAVSNYSHNQCKLNANSEIVAHQRQNLCWPVLDRMGKLIVVETNVAEVDLELILFKQ